MLLVFGSINLDLVTRTASIPRAGETVLADRYHTWFGGKGANQAVAAARSRPNPARPVLMAGAVGDDNFGRSACENLRNAGVDTSGIAVAALPTGCAFITVADDGENAITVASGANREVRAAAVPDTVLTAAAVLVLQMEVPFAENLAMARRARAAGVRVVLNLAPAPGPAEGALLGGLLDATDILVVNELEALAAQALLGGRGMGREGVDGEAAMAAIARECRLTSIMTLGADGAVAIGPDGTVSRAAALAVTPVDTTGAGDTFVGILAASMASGMGLDHALPRACHGASLACLQHGAQPGMPTSAALETSALETSALAT